MRTVSVLGGRCAAYIPQFRTLLLGSPGIYGPWTASLGGKFPYRSTCLHYTVRLLLNYRFPGNHSPVPPRDFFHFSLGFLPYCYLRSFLPAPCWISFNNSVFCWTGTTDALFSPAYLHATTFAGQWVLPRCWTLAAATGAYTRLPPTATTMRALLWNCLLPPHRDTA